jgi:hypothetical protein
VHQWLKVMHLFDGSVVDTVGDPHRIAASGEPVLCPAYEVGDHLVIYLAGTYRCPAIVEVVEAPFFDPDRDRWGWRTPVRLLGEVPLDDAPTLYDLGILPRALARLSRLRLRPQQYEPAAAAILGGG